MRLVCVIDTKSYGRFRITRDSNRHLHFESQRDADPDLLGERAKVWESYPSPHDEGENESEYLLPDVYEEIIDAIFALPKEGPA